MRKRLPCRPAGSGLHPHRNRCKITKALAQIADREEDVVPALIEALEYEVAGVRMSAAEALGHAGQVARTAVPALIDRVTDPREDLLAREFAISALAKIDPGNAAVEDALVYTISDGNLRIYEAAQRDPKLRGMGTTVVAAAFYDDRMSIAHVGDSRLYRLRDGELEQVTSDHSLLQELVDRGFYTREEAQRSTNRNYVTRALGVEPTVEVEVHEFDVLPDDVYLLCSDGLPDMVEDDDIHLTISTFNDSLEVVGQQLVDLANDHGGRDNVSVMLAQVKEAFPAKRGLIAKIAGMFRS